MASHTITTAEGGGAVPHSGASASSDAPPTDLPTELLPVLGPGSPVAAVLDAHGLRLPAELRLGRFDATQEPGRDTDGVLPLYLSGNALLVAPPRQPGQAQLAAPCAGCLALRWQKLRSQPERDVLERDSRFEGVGVNPLHTSPLVRHTAALLVERVVRQDAPRSEPHGLPLVHALALDTGLVQQYPLVPDPQCGCAQRPADSAELATLDLVSRRKLDEDSLRCRQAADYDVPFTAFANPVCGVIGDGMVPDTTSTTTAPVTGFTLMRGSWLLHDFYWSGHGDDYNASGTLAVLEGLERYAGLQRTRQTRLTRGSRAQLGTADTLDPRDCGVYPDTFYDDEPFFVPYTDDLEMNWVWGYSLRDEAPIRVPERLVYYLDADRESNFVQECSNGCAAGANLEEATLYGLLELIERDAFLIGWYGGACLPEIDPDTVPSRAVRFMVARMRAIGYQVRLFDNRIDLDVPVVTAVAVHEDPTVSGQVALAAGASLDPVDAIRAALCEIASYAPSFPDRVDAVIDSIRPMVDDFDQVKELPHHALLFGLPEMKHHLDHLLGEDRAAPMDQVFAGWEDRRPRGTDLLEDLRHCLEQVIRAGHDVIVVEQTSPEQQLLGLSTACVVVPGMIPIDFGWSKQRAPHLPRLRTALERSGHRSRLLDSQELHLVPHPFP